MSHGVPEPVLVMDALRAPTPVLPGVVDDNAKHVYRNGQCLALAIAIAEATWQPLLLHLAPTGPGRLPVLVHAWAFTTRRRLVDINGVVDETDIDTQMWDGDVKYVVSAGDTTELLLALGDSIPEQNLDVARTFVDPVLNAAGVPAGK